MEYMTRIFFGKVAQRSHGRCYVTHSPAKLGFGCGVVSYRERPWFTTEEDALTPGQADRVLARGKGYPRHERTLCLVFSLLPEERKRLGGEDPLYEAMVKATRAAMRVFAEEIRAEELVWVASVRADYPHPCVKVLVDKQIRVKYRQQAQFQETLPRRLRPHWARTKVKGEAARRFVPGPCGEAFLSVLDAALTGASDGTIS